MKKSNQKKIKTKTEVTKSTTLIGAIEKRLDIDLGVNPKMQFGTYLQKIGYPSLSQMLSDN